ncbi:MAG: nucleotidyltransferase domain-containing protein [Ignavibacteriales bacterium]|nr:nucleotidyltransferase domain-containing protein [Ignavibacteriales bacterium]
MPDKKLEEIINRILKVIIPDKIILFGSRAKGNSRPESDYDILIIKSGPINEAKIEGDIS